MEGWIKLYRQLLTNGWFQNHNLLVVWLYCLLKATHKPMTVTVGYQQVPLEPGQFIFGRKRASEETGLSEQEIRTALGSLVTRQNLTIKSTNKFSIISITNWDCYQGSKDDDQPSTQPATNQQLTTNNNGKKGKKTSSPASPNPAVKEFIDFWFQAFQEKFGKPYAVNGGKEGALVKRLLGVHPLEYLKDLGEAFFKSADPFIQNSGYTIGVFSSQVNKLAAESSQRKNTW